MKTKLDIRLYELSDIPKRNKMIRELANKKITTLRLPYMYEVRDMIAKKGIELSTEQVRMIVKGE